MHLLGEKEFDSYKAWIYFTTKCETGVCQENVDQVRLLLDSIPNEGTTIRRTSNWLNAVSVRASHQQIHALSRLPVVDYIDVVASFSTRRTESRPAASPDSKVFTPRAGRTANSHDYGSSFTQNANINAIAAHTRGLNGSDVVILILDSGFNIDHESVSSATVLDSYDFLTDTPGVGNKPGENPSQHQHGTAVWSIIGGYKPGKIVGVAHGAKFLLAKTESYDFETRVEEDNFIAAVEWGYSRGAQVVTASLGYMDWYTKEDLTGLVAPTSRVLDMAVNRGLSVVISAGNYGRNGAKTIVTPADAFNVISVGATEPNSYTVTTFSSRGPTSDGRYKPEVCAQGSSVFIASPNNGLEGYSSSSGTSFSAPLVAGAVAILKQQHPDWTPLQIRKALMQSASNANTPNNLIGWGVINLLSALDTPRAELSIPSCYNNCSSFNSTVMNDYRGVCHEGECFCYAPFIGDHCQYSSAGQTIFSFIVLVSILLAL